MPATGEAVNYETAIATLDDMIADVRGQIDAAQSALDKMAEAKAAVDALQQTYQPTAEAAGTKLDHEAALGLDATTLGHAGTTVDALPPNAVDGLYDQVEQIEQLTNERLAQAEIALSSLEAERAHLVATYGDAHATVAGNLGGDSRFLDSGGPAAPAAGPATAGAGGPRPEHTGMDAPAPLDPAPTSESPGLSVDSMEFGSSGPGRDGPGRSGRRTQTNTFNGDFKAGGDVTFGDGQPATGAI